MTKKALIIIFCFLFSVSFRTFSQKKFPTEHSIGITGGVNLCKVSMQPDVVQDFKMGETFGVVYRYIEEKFFGIQAELLYAKRGWKDRLEDFPNYHFERSFDYIELPIMSHIFFGNNRVKGFVNLGPSISYYLGNDKINTNIISPEEMAFETTHHGLAISNRFDYGIIGGGGLELRFGKNSFIIEGRYYFGLGDIFPNEKRDYFESSAHQYVSIKAAYLFHLGKKK